MYQLVAVLEQCYYHQEQLLKDQQHQLMVWCGITAQQGKTKFIRADLGMLFRLLTPLII
jgi:hypothetical protein